MTWDHERALHLADVFEAQFGSSPATVVRAPGRVNLLGEHTDYNEGFVLPMAIDRSVLVCARPRNDRYVRIYFANYRRSVSFSLDEKFSPYSRKLSRLKSAVYLWGVAACLEARGYVLRGMDAAIEGNVPVGSGLSSSAALEMAIVLAFEAVSGIYVPPEEKARIGQQVENEFLGVQSGIMDQLVSVQGVKGCAILIDCRTLAHDLIPVSARGMKIVVCDSGVRRSLNKSEYNVRREECREGVRILSKCMADVESLRDVSLSDLDSWGDRLPEKVRNRCVHVVSENERVLQGALALKRGDTARFGRFMIESHQSLRDLYEVSCRELDLLVDSAMRVEGVVGSRMTGAGFGGCTVNLIHSECLDDFKCRVSADYQRLAGRGVRIWACEPAEGAGVLGPEND